MSRLIEIVIIVVLASLLLGVRWFQNELFYDPLIYFFETDHTSQNLPQMIPGKLMLHLWFRFLVNSLISLGILWFLFKRKDFIKLSIVLYLLLFIVLACVFYILNFHSNTTNFMSLFYVRRFLIQPILLLVLIPAFYFQKK